jgi:hypothetical protein
MTFKTLIATVAIALAFAPSAAADGPQQAKWRAYDEAVRTAYDAPVQAKWRAYDAAVRKAHAPVPAARTPAPVATTDDPIPTLGRIALAVMVIFAAAAIVFIRRRDALRTATAGGWDR